MPKEKTGFAIEYLEYLDYDAEALKGVEFIKAINARAAHRQARKIYDRKYAKFGYLNWRISLIAPDTGGPDISMPKVYYSPGHRTWFDD